MGGLETLISDPILRPLKVIGKCDRSIYLQVVTNIILSVGVQNIPLSWANFVVGGWIQMSSSYTVSLRTHAKQSQEFLLANLSVLVYSLKAVSIYYTLVGGGSWNYRTPSEQYSVITHWLSRDHERCSPTDTLRLWQTICWWVTCIHKCCGYKTTPLKGIRALLRIVTRNSSKTSTYF